MSENSQENSENFPEKSPNNPNFKRYASGTWYTAIPANFFKFVERGALKHYHFSIALCLWNHTYNSRNRRGDYDKLYEFTLGRSELSEVAFCGKRQAREAIEALKECGLLIPVEFKRGYSFTYRWNVEMLKDKNMVVPERYNQLSLMGTASCTQEGQPPVPGRYNIYIEDFIYYKILSYNDSFAGHNVDNSNPGEAVASGEQKSGASAPLVSDEKVAAWIAAGRTCGEAFGYHLVHLVISYHRPLQFEKIDYPDLFLKTLLSDQPTIYELQKLNPRHYASNEEFLALYGKVFSENIKASITKEERE